MKKSSHEGGRPVNLYLAPLLGGSALGVCSICEAVET